MTKKTVIFHCLILAGALALTLSWRWYQTPYAEINPVCWQGTVITYGPGQHQTLWLNRRHAANLKLAAAWLQAKDVEQIPVQLVSISYPALHPSAIRVDFDLVDPENKLFLMKQKRVVIKQRR
ncbi:hypothetical protein [Arsukibacterium indicum]|uniref:Uncharacterized protein n=1 Tax=Arsukibacterium indicum TaxID=2848612 RepID=A0ABS6MNA2_9GAMM|nr:hypothetical protein [Arsukibacterium indicum]MBV2130280.1 hypothetical protein [Arsukibacterium indicum]